MTKLSRRLKKNKKNRTIKRGGAGNDINNMKSPENVNILNTYVLSELIANDGNKFVILPIGNFDLTFGELSNYSSVIANEIKNDSQYPNHVKSIFHNAVGRANNNEEAKNNLRRAMDKMRSESRLNSDVERHLNNIISRL